MTRLMNAHLKSFNQLMTEVFMAKMHRTFEGAVKQSLPVKPTIPILEVRKLRAQLMLEECLETINKGLGLSVHLKMFDVKIEDFEYRERGNPSLVEIADGLADLEVVGSCGTASACGIALEPIYNAVANDNLMKFAPGHRFSETGKLIKPPDHEGPTEIIKALLMEQGMEEKDA